MKFEQPIVFREQNKVLGRPEGMTAEECSAMAVYTDGKRCISKWKIPFWKRFLILFTGIVWVSVLSGTTQPPISIQSETPFLPENKWKVIFRNFFFRINQFITIRKEIAEGEKFPKFYGCAWRRWDLILTSDYKIICYPIPLNRVLGICREVYYYFGRTRKNDLFQETYSAGIIKGMNIKDEITKHSVNIVNLIQKQLQENLNNLRQ